MNSLQNQCFQNQCFQNQCFQDQRFQDQLLQIQDFTQALAPVAEIPELTCQNQLSEESEKVRRIATLMFVVMCQEVSPQSKQKIRSLVEKMCLMGKSDPVVGMICQLFFKAVFTSEKISTFSPLFTPSAVPFIERFYHLDLLCNIGHATDPGILRTHMMFTYTVFHDPDVSLADFILTFDSAMRFLDQCLALSNFRRVAECLDLIYENNWSEAFTEYLTSNQYFNNMDRLFLLGNVLARFAKNMVQILAYKETEVPPSKRQNVEARSLNTCSCFMHKAYVDSVPFFKGQFNPHWTSANGQQCQIFEIGVEDPEVLIEIMRHLTWQRSSIKLSGKIAIATFPEEQKSVDATITILQNCVTTCERLIELSLPQLYWNLLTTGVSPLKFLNETKTLYTYTRRYELAQQTHSPFFLAKHFSFLIDGVVNEKKYALSFLKRYHNNEVSHLLQCLDKERILIAPYLDVSFTQLKTIGESDKSAFLRICSAIITVGSPVCGSWWNSFVHEFLADSTSSQIAPAVLNDLFEKKTPFGYNLGLRLLRRIGSARYQEALELAQKLVTDDVVFVLNSEIKKDKNSPLLLEMLLTVAAFGGTKLFDLENIQVHFESFMYYAAAVAPNRCFDLLKKSDDIVLLSQLFWAGSLNNQDIFIRNCKDSAKKVLESNRPLSFEELGTLREFQRSKIIPEETVLPTHADESLVHRSRISWGGSCTNQYHIRLQTGTGMQPLFGKLPLPWDLLRAFFTIHDPKNVPQNIPPEGSTNFTLNASVHIVNQLKDLQNIVMFKIKDFARLLQAITFSNPNTEFSKDLRCLLFLVAKSSPMIFHIQQERGYAFLGYLLKLLGHPKITKYLSEAEKPEYFALLQLIWNRVQSLCSKEHAKEFEQIKQGILRFILEQHPESPIRQELLAFFGHTNT